MNPVSSSSPLLETSQSHLAYAQSLHQHLMDLHQELSQSYNMEQEDHIFRLSIERDEALVLWGKSVLALCAQGFEVSLTTPQGRQVKAMGVLDPSLISSSASISSSVDFPLDSSPTPSSIPTPSSHSAESTNKYKAVIIDSSNSSSSSSVESISSSFDSIDRDDDQNDETQGEADATPISLNQFSLEDLKAQINQPKGWSQFAVDPVESDDEWKALGQEMIKRLGPPQLYSASQVKEQLIQLESEVDCCQQWSIFNRDIQNAFLTLITSRLRKIQETLGENLFDQDRIAKMFRRLTRFSSDFRPGFIHGLSRDKIPEFDSWATDEKEAWKRLESALGFKKEASALGVDAQKYLEEVKRVLQLGEHHEQFSVELRRTIVDCLNFGIQPEHPHLVELILKHLSHLSGRRFKKLRQAALEYGR